MPEEEEIESNKVMIEQTIVGRSEKFVYPLSTILELLRSTPHINNIIQAERDLRDGLTLQSIPGVSYKIVARQHLATKRKPRL